MSNHHLHLKVQDAITSHDYKSVLCLNGDLPDPHFIKSFHLPVVATDGAAHYLVDHAIWPFAIVGDLDSLDVSAFQNHNLVHLPSQSTSDFQKALGYLSTNNLLPAIILGMNGGCLDHILNNVSIFKKSGCSFFAEPILGFVIKSGDTKVLNDIANTKISLMGIPNALVSSAGLKWELSRAALAMFEDNSCFNRVASHQTSITVHEGELLVMIYLDDVNDSGSLDQSHLKFK